MQISRIQITKFQFRYMQLGIIKNISLGLIQKYL